MYQSDKTLVVGEYPEGVVPADANVRALELLLAISPSWLCQSWLSD